MRARDRLQLRIRRFAFRTRYREFLSRDYPRVPLPRTFALLDALAGLGNGLVQSHLLRSSAVSNAMATYVGPSSPEVDKVTYVGSTVWLDKN